MLSERGGGNEGEGSRKLKTEFLVQFDGVSSGDATQLTVMGATNRPQEIDEAARRRFTKRIYIPLPDASGRLQLLDSLLSKHKVKMSAKGTFIYHVAVAAGMCMLRRALSICCCSRCREKANCRPYCALFWSRPACALWRRSDGPNQGTSTGADTNHRRVCSAAGVLQGPARGVRTYSALSGRSASC